MKVLLLFIFFLSFFGLVCARRHESTAIRSDLEELERDVSKLIFMQDEEQLKEPTNLTEPMNITDTILFYRMKGKITLTVAKNGNSVCLFGPRDTTLSISFDGSKPGIGLTEFFADMIGKLEIHGCDIKLPKRTLITAKVLIRGLAAVAATAGNAISSWRTLKSSGKALVNFSKGDRSSSANSALETRGQFGLDDINRAWDKVTAFAKDTVKDFKEKGFKGGFKALGHKTWNGIKNGIKSVLMKYLNNNSEAIVSLIRNVLTSVTSVKLDLEFDPAPRNRDHNSCQTLPPNGSAFFGPNTRAGFTVTLTVKDPRGRPVNTFMDMVSHLGLKDANGYFSKKMTVSNYGLRKGNKPVAFTRVVTKGWAPNDASAPITIELSDEGIFGRNKLMYCTKTTMGRAWEEVTKLSTTSSSKTCPLPRSDVAEALSKPFSCTDQKPSTTTPCLPGSFVMRVVNYFLPNELKRLYSYSPPPAPELDKPTWIARAKAITKDMTCSHCPGSKDSTVDSFNLPYLAAILSNAAYVNKLKSDITVQDLNKRNVTFTFVNQTDREEPFSAAVLIVSSPGILWVAFQGTESRKDACIDATLEMENLGDGFGRVHKGFNAQWKVLRDNVFEVVRRSSEPKIVVTGHSLGAGIAQIAALMIKKFLEEARSRSTEMNVFLFGSPRCGDETFQTAWDRKFAGKAASFVNTFDMNFGFGWVERAVDIVTLVPPTGFGFSHVAPRCRCSLPCPIPDAINMVPNTSLPLDCHSMNHYQNAFLAFA